MPTWIQLDDRINLDSQEIYDFVLDGTRTVFRPPALPSESGFTLVNTKKPGEANTGEFAAQSDLASPLLAAKRLHFSVLRNRTNVIGSFSVIVIVKQFVTITVSSFLLIRNDVSKPIADKITAAFINYDPLKEPDPIKYALANLGQDITPDMFLVRPSFTLEKKGEAEEDKTELENIIKLYDGSRTKSTIFVIGAGEQNLSSHLHDSGISVKNLGTDELIGRVPVPTHDTVHEREFNKPTQEDQVLNDIVNLEKVGLECTALTPPEQRKILTVLEWPELKVCFEDTSIRLGCFTVVLTLPVPHLRLVKKSLFAYVAHLPNIDQIVPEGRKILQTCLVTSAIAGTVLGLVLLDFGAALAAFVAVFENCVRIAAEQTVACLVPGLALIDEADPFPC